MVIYKEDEIPLRDKYVAPFYLTVLHGNLIRYMEQAEQDIWLANFCRTAYELEESDAHTLFAVKDWRSRLAMSWMVGFREWNEFVPILENKFDSDTGHARSGVVIGLALLGSSTSAKVFCDHLDRAFAGDDIEAMYTWALAALIEIDKRNQTSFSEQYLGDNGPWEKWRKEGLGQDLAPVGEIVRLLSGFRQKPDTCR